MTYAVATFCIVRGWRKAHHNLPLALQTSSGADSRLEQLGMCPVDGGDGVAEHVGRDADLQAVLGQHLGQALQPLSAGRRGERRGVVERGRLKAGIVSGKRT